MSTVTLTIRYESPADDPLKVPRPTYVTGDQYEYLRHPKTTGGEPELAGDSFMGLSHQAGAPESFGSEHWRAVEDLMTADPLPDVSGWYPAFIRPDDGSIYTYERAVSTIEREA